MPWGVDGRMDEWMDGRMGVFLHSNYSIHHLLRRMYWYLHAVPAELSMDTQVHSICIQDHIWKFLRVRPSPWLRFRQWLLWIIWFRLLWMIDVDGQTDRLWFGGGNSYIYYELPTYLKNSALVPELLVSSMVFLSFSVVQVARVGIKHEGDIGDVLRTWHRREGKTWDKTLQPWLTTVIAYPRYLDR